MLRRARADRSARPALRERLGIPRQLPEGERVSGQVLAERFDAWRERRHVSAAKVLALLIGVAVVALSLYGGISANSYQQASAENRQAADSLREEISDARGSPEQVVPAKRLNRVQQEASRLANSVVGKQNEFPSRLADLPGKKAMDALVDLRRETASFWQPGSLLIADDAAYDSSMAGGRQDVPTDPDQIDPRFAWYAVQVSGKAVCRWQVAGITVDLETGNSAEVLLTCTPPAEHESAGIKKGSIFAWAAATYDARSKRLGDLSVTVTTAGAEVRGPEPTREIPPLPAAPGQKGKEAS